MYFWDSRRLAADLRNDAVPAATLRNHLIAWLLIGVPGAFTPLGSTGNGKASDAGYWQEAFLIGCSIVIIVIGIRRAYQANGGDQGSRFVEKSVALLLPLTIQAIVFFVSVMLLILYSLNVLAYRGWAGYEILDRSLIDAVWTTLLVLTVQSWLLWRLVVHLRDMRRADVDASPPLNAPAPAAAPHH